ncbi:FecR domain-containing protein [Chitinophaga sp. 212800010-3]|uniref:FecR family protein n=1 Tax=unclassified Chitinophaga TaxID=2619133 RepID=UPI002DEE78F7|nr:hypothetical protein [Chitinophaga sp. 212800010-3]
MMERTEHQFQQILELLKKRATGGTITSEELTILNNWLHSNQYNEELWNNLSSSSWMEHEIKTYARVDQESVRKKIVILRSSRVKPRIRRLLPQISWSIAAAVLVAIGAFWWFNYNSRHNEPTLVNVQQEKILPGMNGALLTLADGSSISLDSIKNGTITTSGGVTAKVNNGTLQYIGHTNELTFNKVSTPKGRQFTVQLPDGSLALLNSASSIRYPMTFIGSIRDIEITGEVYFDVKQNAKQPFIVNTDRGLRIEVLGTKFNINSYNNEPVIKTTLIDGKVRLTTGAQNSNATLLPGQQAQYNQPGDAGAKISIQQLDQPGLDRVLAWKNGLFIFNNDKLPDIMRQLERWYDISVIYGQHIPVRTFSGKIYRDVPLSELLDIFQGMGVKFALDGRTLTVEEE